MPCTFTGGRGTYHPKRSKKPRGRRTLEHEEGIAGAGFATLQKSREFVEGHRACLPGRFHHFSRGVESACLSGEKNEHRANLLDGRAEWRKCGKVASFWKKYCQATPVRLMKRS